MTELIHYPSNSGATRAPLCGLPFEGRFTTTWLRRAVTCERCRARFDLSLLELRRLWNRLKRRAR